MTALVSGDCSSFRSCSVARMECDGTPQRKKVMLRVAVLHSRCRTCDHSLCLARCPTEVGTDSYFGFGGERVVLFSCLRSLILLPDTWPLPWISLAFV